MQSTHRVLILDILMTSSNGAAARELSPSVWRISLS